MGLYSPGNSRFVQSVCEKELKMNSLIILSGLVAAVCASVGPYGDYGYGPVGHHSAGVAGFPYDGPGYGALYGHHGYGGYGHGHGYHGYGHGYGHAPRLGKWVIG